MAGKLPTEKLQKVLARAGLGSRREVEGWIRMGRLNVNGRTAALGMRVSGHDLIRLDGRRLHLRSAAGPGVRVLLYNKPRGEVCARRDNKGRPTVFDRLPPLNGGRWVSVGRLDVNTSGLLLFTNAGELAHRLMHPSAGVEREYLVRVFGKPEHDAIARMRDGVLLEDGLARFESVIHAGGTGLNRWYRVTIKEGRNREVRRLWDSQGGRVSRLARIRYGPIRIRRGLRAGHWMELGYPHVAALLAAAGLTEEAEARRGMRGRRAR